MADITPEQGRTITLEALDWNGTPYALIGRGSIKGQGGDCSGSTWRIYSKVGFPYEYNSTATFPAYVNRSGLFRMLTGIEASQDGDILLWDEHMAIFSSFRSGLEAPHRTTPRVNKKGNKWTQLNDMWTAHYTDGPPYSTGASKYFSSDAPNVYRYVGPFQAP